MRSRKGDRRVAAALGLALLAGLSLQPRDPRLYPGWGAQVTVVDHGWHSGLVIRVSDLAAADVPDAAAARLGAIAAPFPGAVALEFGWGDHAFYRAVRSPADVTLGLALPAILWPTPGAVQVVPLYGPPEAAFWAAGRVRLRLSRLGFRNLLRRLAGEVAEGAGGHPKVLGPSLYGQGLFFAARRSYHGFFTCNQWVASLLSAAGVPASWALATTSAGLSWELRRRAAPLGY